jgi:hypothetical protein
VAGSSENKANLAQLGLELGLSLAKLVYKNVKLCNEELEVGK